MGKIKKWFYRIFYSLPFGLKSVDDIIFTSKHTSNSDDVGIHEVIQSNRLSKDLLKGEVTQQVEELRYKDYKVSREASRYSYNGDGTASRKEDEKTRHIKFSQSNKLEINGIVDGSNIDEKYGSNMTKRDNYTLNIIYQDIPRFRLESFCKMFDVDTTNQMINLHFSTFADRYDSKSKSFLNEMDKVMYNLNSGVNVIRNEICSNIEVMSFTTYKADGEDDMVRYTLKDLICVSGYKGGFEYVLTFKFNSYDREDLLNKFYSPTMQAKYDNKETKEVFTQFLDEPQEYFICVECGDVMNDVDAKITKATYGYPICQKCLKKLDLNV